MVMTKMRHGECGIPKHKMMALIDHCKSYALVQWLAHKCNMKLIPMREWGEIVKRDNTKDARIAELEQRLSQYEDVQQSR